MANPVGFNARPAPDWRTLERARIAEAYLFNSPIYRVSWKCNHAAHEPTDSHLGRILRAPAHCSEEWCMKGAKAPGALPESLPSVAPGADEHRRKESKMGLSEPRTHTVTVGPDLQVWQASCLACGWAYALMLDAEAKERPRYCAMCGALAVWTRRDNE